MNILRQSVFFLLLTGLLACAPLKTEVDERDVSFLYNPSSSSLHPEFLLYHNSDTTSRLMVLIFPYELLFNKANEQLTYMARLKVSYELILTGDLEILTDTATVIYNIDMDDVSEAFITSISIKTRTPGKYKLKVTVSDLLRKTGILTFLSVDKSNIYKSQNFAVRKKNIGIPSFNPYYSKGDSIQISHYKSNIDSLYITYYRNKSPAPQPPSSSSPPPNPANFESDSLWTVKYENNLGFHLPYEGIYFIRIDPTSVDGFTLFNFGEFYPVIKTPQKMIKPLVYICSTTDYRYLNNEPDQKTVLDEFWFDKTEDLERSRELIRIYYNRTFFANLYFTSYKEGWKTDRGMIYIVYGPPNIVYKTDIDEKWIYLGKKKTTIMEYTFMKEENNPFTNDNYQLNRGVGAATYWGRAMEAWRNGETFILN